jgi:predicted nucleic acid-binding protein
MADYYADSSVLVKRHVHEAGTAICATEYQFVELTAPVVERARLLLERYPLRAYDAVQLASAVLTHETFQTVGLPPLVFLAADDRLLAAAQAEGLMTENPSAHP